MKVVFLDFDGVLNSHAFLVAGKHGGVMGLDPSAVARVNTIIERTGAMVVVSSSWRLGLRRTQLCDRLNDAGFKGTVLGVTPDLTVVTSGVCQAHERGDEIQAWIDEHADYYSRRFGALDSFVILDDNSDMAHLGARLVLTKWETGITDDDVEKAIAVLETPLARDRGQQ